MSAREIRDALLECSDRKAALRWDANTPSRVLKTVYRKYDAILQKEDSLFAQALELLTFHEEQVRILQEILRD